MPSLMRFHALACTAALLYLSAAAQAALKVGDIAPFSRRLPPLPARLLTLT